MTSGSLDDYLATVRLTRDDWDVPAHHELWFRAESAEYHKTRLQPGLYRPRVDGKRESVKTLLKLENDLYREFGRCATQLADLKLGDDDWDPYFLMQHHGVPTRILDWTDGALIALHFAVRGKSEPATNGSIIYVLDVWWLVKYLEKHPDRKNAIRRWKKYNKNHPYDTSEDDWDSLYLPMDEEDEEEPLLATPNVPLLWDSPHVTRRVAAQRSRYMIFGIDPLWLSALAGKNDSHILEIEIPGDSIAPIKQELRDAGITESVIFPDLDGLGRELRQLWELRR
jgi:hypothetical protein